MGTPAFLLALGVVGLAAYANSFQAGLTLDSKFIIGLDPRIRALTTENLRLIFTENYWWPFTEGDLYRPLTTLTYLLQYAGLGHGDRVFGYHVVNFLLHWVNAGLVFLLLRRLSASAELAGIAAAIFVVHPVNVEAVTNLVGRADLLAAGSVLAAAVCYLQATLRPSGSGKAWLGLAGMFACLGVLAKESAVMILPCFLLFDLFWRWPERSWQERGRRPVAVAMEWVLKGWVAFVPAMLLLLGLRLGLASNLIPPGQAFVDNPIYFASPLAGRLTALGVIGRYLALLVFPGTLSCDYSYDQIPLYGEAATGWQEVVPWASLVIVAHLVWTAIRWRRSRPLLAWSIAFFFVMLLPVSNLVLPIGSIMAERFLYLPSVGFCAAAAAALHAVGTRGPGWRRVLPFLLVTALAVRTHARNADWRDELSLWRSAVASSPHSFKSHLGYSVPIWENGRNEPALDAAIARAESGLRILERVPLAVERRDQSLISQLGVYYRFKGEFCAKQGAPAEARHFFLKSVDCLKWAREVERWHSARLRAALTRHGRSPASDLSLAGTARIHVELAVNCMLLQDWEELDAAAREIQRYAPSDPGGYAFQAVAAANRGRHDAAATFFLAALLLNPADQEVRGNLARSFARLGIEPSPVSVSGTALTIVGGNPRSRPHLDEACALLVRNHDTAGRADEARSWRERATREFQVPVAVFGR